MQWADAKIRPEASKGNVEDVSCTSHVGIGVQAGSGLHAEREEVTEERGSLEAEIQELQEELGEARERLRWLEDMCLGY